MKKIIILGGGFGGIRCALDLSRQADILAEEILIVDKNAAHIFTPALYEVAAAYRESQDVNSLTLRRSVSIPYNEIFAGTLVRHIQGEINFLDVHSKNIYLKDGTEIAYDYCVCALGSQSTDYNIPGVTQYAYFFKTADDAFRVNTKLFQLFQKYLNGPREKPIQIILAGAGFTGVELAAELSFCLYKLGRAHDIHKKFFTITIFEAAPEILTMMNPRERKIIMKRLAEIGVAILDHSPIESVHADQVKLADGHVTRADMVIWTAGIKPHQLFSQIPNFPLTDRKKIKVDQHLRIEGSDSIFAIGDTIEFINPQNQQPVPALAYHAIQQGKIVASNIKASIQNRSLHSYKPKVNSWAVPIGAKFALVQISSSFWIYGFAGWLIRLWVDLRYFLSILPIKKAFSLFKKDLVLFVKND